MVQIGRVVYIANGKNKGKLAVIVNIVDGNRLLVDGPCSGVLRCVVNVQDVQLTKFRLMPILINQRTGIVKKMWEAEKMTQKWEASNWAKKIAMKQKRASMSDFDRFKLFKAKQARNRIIRTEMAKLKKSAK